MRHAVLRVRGHGPHHVNEVGYYRRCGRFGAGATAVKHGRPHCIAHHEHGVHDALHAGDGVTLRNQRRMYAQFDTVAAMPRNAERLDAVAEFIGIGEVHGADLADALGVHLFELQRDAEGDGRQDGELVGRVNAINVDGRIGFGVTQALCFGQHGLEIRATLVHLGEDVIASAIDDASHSLNAIAGQAFTNGLDDGNAARYRSLERHHDALALSGVKDLVAMQRDQRLVGGDHMLTLVDGG